MSRGVRPRVYCPHCGRSTAVTTGRVGKTGVALYLRPHVVIAGSPCPASGRTVTHLPVHYPERSTA